MVRLLPAIVPATTTQSRELRLRWTDIADWRYIRVQDVEGFWVRDRTGKKHELKHWLVYGRQRSRQVAEILRQQGVFGYEEYDG